MRVLRLTDRERRSCATRFFLDLTGRSPDFPVPSAFRIGDKASALALVSCHWRNDPSGHLTVVDVGYHCYGAEESHVLAPDWLFQGYADEVRIAEGPDDSLVFPVESQPLLTQPVWWTNRTCHRLLDVYSPPLPALTSPLPLTAPYCCIHPLMGRDYDLARNFPSEWWSELIDLLKVDSQVLIVGKSLPACVSNRATAFTDRPLFDTFHAIQGAQFFIGGNTGTTHWAPLLGTPTFAIYPDEFMFENYRNRPGVPSGVEADVSPQHHSVPVETIRLCDPALVFSQLQLFLRACVAQKC